MQTHVTAQKCLVGYHTSALKNLNKQVLITSLNFNVFKYISHSYHQRHCFQWLQNIIIRAGQKKCNVYSLFYSLFLTLFGFFTFFSFFAFFSLFFAFYSKFLFFCFAHIQTRAVTSFFRVENSGFWQTR